MSEKPILPIVTADLPHPSASPVMRQFGNPSAVGLSAFATTTLVLSIFNTGIPSAKAEPVVLGLAFFYGGTVQMIAGIWEFIVNSTFGGTAFLSYGGFWMSFAYFVMYVKPTMEAEHIHEALAIYLLSWTIFTLMMLVGSLKTNKGLFSIFFLLEITFILLTAGHFAHNDKTIHAGGWLGIATAFAAFYVAAANLYKSTWKVELLPLGSLDK